MSVTSLLRIKEFREIIDELVPNIPKSIPVPIIHEPITNDYSLVGTAFDYALRFELERGYPQCVKKDLVYERSIQILRAEVYNVIIRGVSQKKLTKISGEQLSLEDGLVLLNDAVIESKKYAKLSEQILRKAVMSVSKTFFNKTDNPYIGYTFKPGVFDIPGSTEAIRLKRLVLIWVYLENEIYNFKLHNESYTKNTNSSAKERVKMIRYSLLLARLDTLVRAGKFSYDDFEAIKQKGENFGNIQDIINMLDIFPYNNFVKNTPILLNPTFGNYSNMVGGADCDLILGNTLIDLKVTRKPTIRKDYIRQVISYAILAKEFRGYDRSFPEIENIGIYFARHGYLFTLPSKVIYDNPDYNELIDLYFENCDILFGRTMPKLKL